MEWHHSEHNKECIGIEYRHCIEFERTAEKAPPLLSWQRADKFAVVDIEEHSAQQQYNIE
jgi:hypothetical protein